MKGRFLPLLVAICAAGLPASAPAQTVAEFMSVDAAQPTLREYSGSLPAALSPKPDSAAWTAWVKAQDADIRQRLISGEEDTLTNLLRWGVTFTKEYQIDREYLARYGNSTLVDAFANNRADDLIRALSSPNANGGMRLMHDFLIQRGYSFQTPADRARVKKYLLGNLARMRDEFAQFRQELPTADVAKQGELYAKRGISLDSNLWPEYALDRALTELAAAGMLKAGSVQRIAIIGPGLDYANKDYGNDFYPPQSIQPFAVLDTLIRLGLTDPKTFQLYTFDISPSVNIHLAAVQKSAAAGNPYIVQLPWNSEVPFSPEYLSGFQSYWQALGDRIGAPVPPAKVPVQVAQSVHIRAVSIRSEVASRVTAVDANIIYQRVPLSADQKFDLVIGTNIFIYYGAFEQSLARANLAAMLRPGGFVLSNDFLADKVTSGLPETHRTSIEVRADPQIVEHIYCYQLRP